MNLNKKLPLLTLLIIPLLGFLINNLGWLDTFKNTTIDWRFKARGELELPKDLSGNPIRVVYVDFDSEALPIIGERPWDRNFFADVGNILLNESYGNAACIGFDFIFSSQSMSKMVPPENVLRSDHAIGNLIQAYPEKVIIAGTYSSIKDPFYMDHMSKPPYRVPAPHSKHKPYTDASNNPFPEIPSYPIIKYENQKQVGKIGLIDFDTLRSKGSIPRIVPAYFEYKGSALSRNLLAGRLKAYAIENQLVTDLILPNDNQSLLELVHMETREPIAKMIARNGFIELVDPDLNLLPIDPNQIPAVLDLPQYHMSIQLILAYYRLGIENVEISDDRKTLIIRHPNHGILHNVPLLDEQLIRINWFSRWLVNPPKNYPKTLPMHLTSNINPRCSIKDVLYYFNLSQQALSKFDSIGLSPSLSFSENEKKLLANVNEKKEALATIEKTLEQNPQLKTPLATPHNNAKKNLILAQKQFQDFKQALELQEQSRAFFELFENAIILIGPVDRIFQDLAPTPFDKTDVPKVGVHGNMVKTILSDRHLTNLPLWTEYIITLLLSLLAIFLYSYHGKKESIFKITGLLLFGIYVFCAFYFFSSQDLIIPLVLPMGSFAITGFIAFCNTAYQENKQKSRIQKLFGSYVSPELVDQMIESEQEPSLGGTDTEITALFSDIQSFSTFSELLSSPQLVELMNEYLTAMTDILHEENGTLDKYIGDAIVAMFGAPIPIENHAYHAVRTTIRMQKMQIELQTKWASEKNKWPGIVTKMQTRIGLNSGIATIGNMGARDRFNYTMMGDNVNLAARCESGSKSLGAYIMITEETMKQCTRVSDEILFRYLDKIIVKGRTEPVGVYEVIGFKNEMSDPVKEGIELYENAYDCYQKQEWDKAIELFSKSAELEIYQPDEDKGILTNPSLIFIDRCKAMKEIPKDEKWDGVYIMKTK